jgi:putative ABC transport system ATP-binding protein
MKSNGTNAEILRMDHVTRTFNGSDSRTIAVRDVCLTGRTGELILILGPSGSGKTTLLSMAAGLLPPTTGQIRLFGSDLTSHRPRELQRLRARNMGFVFQTFRLIESLSAIDNIAIVLEFAGSSHRGARNRARQLLFDLDIGHLADRKPSRFSQGEKQRVAIARAIANSPSLILADEPTACLESKQGTRIIQLLKEYASSGQGCVLVASHDLRLTECADRIYQICDGRMTAVNEHELNSIGT